MGQVITFYSYKGGTGRTMTAASVAWILASNGQRVLAIDWDLEAPGLHSYFAPFLNTTDIGSSDGLIDLLSTYVETSLAPPHPDDGDWLKRAADITRFAVSLDWDFPDRGTLDLVPAGRQDNSYLDKVRRYDWHDLYQRFKGGAFIELVKARMRSEYDYIVIDSPSGTGAGAGVCTIQLPDRLVVLTTLTGQSIAGSLSVAQQVRQLSPEIRLFPAITQVDTTAEVTGAQRGLKDAWEKLGPFLDHLPPGRAGEYWNRVQFPNVPAYSFGDRLVVFDEKSAVTNALITSTEQLVSYLTDGFVTHAAPIAEKLRSAVADWTAADSMHREASPSQDPVQVFISYSHVDKNYMKPNSLLGYLRGLENDRKVEFWWDDEIVTGDKWDEAIRTRIRKTDIAVVLVSQWFLNSAYCTNVEIRGFLQQCEANGLTIFPIMLSACDWEAHDWLRARHFQPEDGQNIEEHYTRAGKKKRLFLEIYSDLKTQAERRTRKPGERDVSLPARPSNASSFAPQTGE